MLPVMSDQWVSGLLEGSIESQCDAWLDLVVGLRTCQLSQTHTDKGAGQSMLPTVMSGQWVSGLLEGGVESLCDAWLDLVVRLSVLTTN